MAQALDGARQAGRLGLRDRSSPRSSAASSAPASTTWSSTGTRVQRRSLGSIFSGDGLVWYGGAIGGAIAVLRWAWWRGFLSLALLDLARRRSRSATPSGASAASSRRRRLRHRVRPALGDVLSGRHGARPTSRCIRRRSTRRSRWGWSPGSCGSCATGCSPGSCSRSTWCCREPSASWSSSCAATTRCSPASRPRSSRAWR